MMNVFENKKGKIILLKMVKTIQENKVYLGDLDGLIGDGDHGMNMNKGFSLFEKRYCKNDFSFTDGLKNLGMLLMNEIGGSMGPIYGTVFIAMAEAGENLETISLEDFSKILEAGYNGLMEIVEHYGGLKAAQRLLTPILRPILGIPGICCVALVSSLQSTDAGAGMTKALRENKDITGNELLIFSAFQLSFIYFYLSCFYSFRYYFFLILYCITHVSPN